MAELLSGGPRRPPRTVHGRFVTSAAAVAGLLVVLPGASGAAAPVAGAPAGDVRCGGVLFDRAALPGRPLGAAEEAGPRVRLADALDLHGWPRAVPYDAATWTVVAAGDDGVLVATVPGRPAVYLPGRRQSGGDWIAGPPCTLR